MHRQIAAMATAVLAAIAIGCGGSAGGDPSKSSHEFSVRADTTMAPVASLTKAKFLAHINSLCRRKWRFVLNAVRETAVVWARKHPKVTPEDNFIRAVHQSYFASIDFLIFDWIHHLGAPPGQTRQIEDVIGTMQEAVELGQREVRVATVAQLEALFADYNRKARQYGLEECLVRGGHLPHPEVFGPQTRYLNSRGKAS
jgi:hypothetical protein